MSVRILVGDCIEMMRALPDESVDLILTDPPYGETSLDWDRWPTGWMIGLKRILAPHGSLWMFGSQRMFIEQASEFGGWQIAQDLVWEKHNGSGLHNDRFRRVHEHAVQFYPSERKWADIFKCPVFTNDAVARTVRSARKPQHWGALKGDRKYESQDGGPRLMRSVMHARSEHGRALHPTQKPIACMMPIIEYSCARGGLILDPFAGSGTTGLAARQLGRDALLIEANETFAAIAQHRLAADAPLFNIGDAA